MDQDMIWSLHVYFDYTLKTYGVYVESRSVCMKKKLIEGGFLHKAEADKARDEWKRSFIQDEIETAESKAGWDPNP